jgi:uncharacterized protein (TIGR02270 family)
MDMVASRVIPVFVHQHLEDAAFLRAMRSLLVRAPHITLMQLLRADERLAAHLDGLSISGAHGAGLSHAALDVPNVGQLFVAAVLAIERRDEAQIERLLSLLDMLPDAARALSSAFGWVSPALLRGLTAPLLVSESPAVRCLGLAACAQHRVDPGAALSDAIEQPHTGLRIRAIRAAGELGRIDFLPACINHLRDNGSAIALPAAWSAALLGDRGNNMKEQKDNASEHTTTNENSYSSGIGTLLNVKHPVLCCSKCFFSD